MLGERIVTQPKVTRAIFLEDSQCCGARTQIAPAVPALSSR